MALTGSLLRARPHSSVAATLFALCQRRRREGFRGQMLEAWLEGEASILDSTCYGIMRQREAAGHPMAIRVYTRSLYRLHAIAQHVFTVSTQYGS